MESGWQCKKCTFINNDCMPRCELCFAERPGWHCNRCTMFNSEYMDQCEVCASKRPALPLSNVEAIDTGKRVPVIDYGKLNRNCVKCGWINPANIKNCTICFTTINKDGKPNPESMIPDGATALGLLSEIRKSKPKNILDFTMNYLTRGEKIVQVKVPYKYRFRRAIKFGNHFEIQDGLKCGTHSINNLFGKRLVCSVKTTASNIVEYLRDPADFPINLEVIKNNNKYFGSKYKLKEQEGFTNYSHADLQLALRLLAYELGESTHKWIAEGDHFVNTDGLKYQKNIVAGWLCNPRGGHWYAVRYNLSENGKDVFTDLNSSNKHPRVIESPPNGYIVSYEYLFSLKKFDNGENSEFWSNWYVPWLKSTGYSHYSEQSYKRKE